MLSLIKRIRCAIATAADIPDVGFDVDTVAASAFLPQDHRLRKFADEFVWADCRLDDTAWCIDVWRDLLHAVSDGLEVDASEFKQLSDGMQTVILNRFCTWNQNEQIAWLAALAEMLV